ncbi:hypothetical protein AX762_10140 [Alkalibacterium sp. 20]|nr:hypothetical protein AX762_10140 [Alkalibacterium sp. 20]
MEQVLVLSMIEAVINGVSTRKVTKIVEKLCGEKISKSFVSSILKRIDPEIEAFEAFVEINPKYEKGLEKLDNGFMDSIQYLNEPEAYHVSL